jgi:nucleoside-diphosphate-sugar epimerase
MRRALIIGGNRFLGRRLAERLKTAGCHVTLINRSGTGAADRIIRADRRNVGALAPALGDETWDAIFDMAAYVPEDCEPAFRVFDERAARYVLVSSIAVYRLGKNLTEDDFSAESYFPPAGRPKYADGKRGVEAQFRRNAPFPFVAVRLPCILGPGDFTRRLEFHIERNRTKQDIFFCNPGAAISLVSVDQASAFLHKVAQTEFNGAVNFAASEPISYAGLMETIAAITGEKPLYATKETAHNGSPYEYTSDMFMAVDRARELAGEPGTIQSWLPDLVRSLVT